MDFLKICIQHGAFQCAMDAYSNILEYVSPLVIIFIFCLLTLFYILLNKKQSAQRKENNSFVKLRFRKREKIWFYGRKMLRRVKLLARPNTVDQMNSLRARVSRKKKLMVSLAGSLFQMKKEQENRRESWKSHDPPSSLLEVNTQDNDKDNNLPSELIYMLRNVRVLGHFEQPIFLELCRYIESSSVEMGDYLFQVGDLDDAIYVVQAGRVLVHVTEPDGKEYCVKEVAQGESVHSLLSVMDMLTGHPTPYRTVSAIATEASLVLRLPTTAFKNVLNKYPESLVRVIQIIMIRLQRVTFLALHNYLGLSQELINHDLVMGESLLPHANIQKSHTSPTHKRTRSNSVFHHDTVIEQNVLPQTYNRHINLLQKRNRSTSVFHNPMQPASGLDPSLFINPQLDKVNTSPNKKTSKTHARTDLNLNRQSIVKQISRKTAIGSVPQSSQNTRTQNSKTSFPTSTKRDNNRKVSALQELSLPKGKKRNVSSVSHKCSSIANNIITEKMDEEIEVNDGNDIPSTLSTTHILNQNIAINSVINKHTKRNFTRSVSFLSSLPSSCFYNDQNTNDNTKGSDEDNTNDNNKKTAHENKNDTDQDDKIACETINNTVANSLTRATNKDSDIQHESIFSDTSTRRSKIVKGLKLALDTKKPHSLKPSDFITACERAGVESKDLFEDKSEEHNRTRSLSPFKSKTLVSKSPLKSPLKSHLTPRSRKKSLDIKKLVSHMHRNQPKSQTSHPLSPKKLPIHDYTSPDHHHSPQKQPNLTDAHLQQRQQHKKLLLQDITQSPSALPLEQRSLLHQTTWNASIDSYFYNPSFDEADSSQLLDLAVKDLARLLGLEDVALLKEKSILRSVRANTMLVKQGEQDCSLYFVASGWLKVLQQIVGKEAGNKTMYVVEAGELIGTLAVLTGEPSFFSVLAITDVKFVHIAKNDFYILMKKQPSIVLNAGHTVVKRMSAFVRQIDFGLDWILIESGRALYQQNDKSDCVYIILNGRLRSVIQLESGKKELVGEYGRGELVGLVEVLTQTDRSTTMMAVRNTEIAQIPDEMLNLIKRKHPQVVTRLIHLLGQRILGSLGNQGTTYGALSEQIDFESRFTAGNLATVAVMAANDNVPLTSFSLELQHSLNSIGSTLRMNSEFVQTMLGKSAFEAVNEFRLSSWLGQQEDVHRMVLYECDPHMSAWTQRCIRQSDCILIVSLADQDPAVGELEKQLESLSVRAQKELVLLHKLDAPLSRNTLQWLNTRQWCSGHHHIRCPRRVLSKKSPMKTKEIYKKVSMQEADHKTDFARLARFLTGTSIGVVLGGGGARGISHVGVVKALIETGIPIDMIGGTSIGSFMGALWAQETKYTPYTQRAREFSRGMTALWKKIFDLTYPVTAMFTGSFLNKEVESVFQDCQIEDLWIPYFCITTDITASKMRVHTHGSLWRYVRSSMSLSGYLPPLCDPNDGHLLLDGGYVNNLPADIMKVMGAQTIFAIDVGAQDETNLTNYGDELSGWWLLWKRFNPWAEQVKVPNMAEIQSRLAYVSCNRQMEQVKKSNYCEYIRPPIDKYQNFQFGSYDEIAEVGYNHAKLLFTEWQKTDRVRDIFLENNAQNKPPQDKNSIPVNANFTDLAELISRIDDADISPSSFLTTSNQWPDSSYDSDTENEDDDNMSVTSEPIVSSNSPTFFPKLRCGSEGATPPESDYSQDDEDYEDEGPPRHHHHHQHRYLKRFEHEDF